MKRFLTLPNAILAALLAGLVFGWIAGATRLLERFPGLNEALSLGGDLFKQLILMVVLPLVFFSLIGGMMGIGDPRRLGRVALKTLVLYALTGALACTIALVFVNTLVPGRHVPAETRDQIAKDYEAQQKKLVAPLAGEAKEAMRPTFWKFARSLVPANVVDALARGQMLPVIFFALLFGLTAATLSGTRRDRFVDLVGSITEVMIRMVGVVMKFAPVGVFCLIATAAASLGLALIRPLAMYCLVVVLALAAHFFIVYGGLIKLLTRVPFLQFCRALRPVFITAFSTSSSAATLPVNLECVTRRLNVPPSVGSFVLPIGATVNMDGTAIMQSVAAVFIAQLYSIPLNVPQQLAIILTALLASVGSAPIPSAGVAMLVLILEPLGIPLEGLALIWAVDRPLDMLRTVVNVTGDGVAAAAVATMEGEDVRYVAEMAATAESAGA
ncbi:MAG: dicarboxylate/amino acid:cation symporter [Planctomycetes bacterium]|nr:dicarboxylate/amino acid:cation symporter [Planctomycetota bacterium]